jgi:hypothetical protein
VDKFPRRARAEASEESPVDMWTIGYAERLRFPRFPKRESGEMLGFAHIPTGATTNQIF